MNRKKLPRLVALGAATVALAFFSPGPARANDAPKGEANTVTAYFPPDYGMTMRSGVPWSGWKIRYGFQPNFHDPDSGAPQYLYIDHAEYVTRDAQGRLATAVPVADDLRIAEVYVRYNGRDDRTADREIPELSNSRGGLLDLQSVPPSPATRSAGSFPDLGPFEYVDLEHEGGAFGRAEYVYDDIRWMEGRRDMGLQYGHKLVLWSALDSDNYRYLIRYVFFDDGSIELQVGATGHNLMNRAGNPGELSAHTHVHLAAWRMSLLLGDSPERNRPWIFDYHQNGFSGKLMRTPIRSETSVDLDAERYQRLSVVGNMRHNPDALLPVSYDLFPVGAGRLRFQTSSDHFAAHDVWITARETRGSGPVPHAAVSRLPSLIDRPAEDLDGRRFDVWTNASFLHIPRQEDFDSQGERMRGVAMTAWSKIRLHARDISLSSPFYQ